MNYILTQLVKSAILQSGGEKKHMRENQKFRWKIFSSKELGMDKEIVALFIEQARKIAESINRVVYGYPHTDGGYYLTTNWDGSHWVLEARPSGKIEVRGIFANERKKAFVICPVRGVEYSREFLDELDELSEKYNVEIHFPPRDTDQDDQTGFRICNDNRKAIEASEIVFVLWDESSRGTLFDLGMAFAMGKQIVLLNPVEPTSGKSFQNMILEWEAKYGRN